jgi:GDPmannose 4,6-dehydratase
MNKTALITGIAGQDGSYLANFLLNKGYKVIGTFRHVSTQSFWRLDYFKLLDHKNLKLIELDISDLSSIIRVVDQEQPNEIYNLAAMSFVGSSFTIPHSTSQITGLAVLNILEAIRIINKKIKFYQASSSEMFGKVQQIPQDENTPFWPRSPYGVAKLYGHWITVNYRESYNIFASCGILFNHESPLRGLDFVTRKISHGVASIAYNKSEYLELGNIDSKRDWGFAGDYVEGMWKILQHDRADNFVLSTNETLSVRDFVTISFKHAGIDIIFKGSGVEEIGLNEKTGKIILKINKKYYRPSEVDLLIGNPAKANSTLNWYSKTTASALAKMMVEEDIKRINN